MEQQPTLAIVGTGVVGQGVLYSWLERGYDVTGYDVDRDTIQKLRDDNVEAFHMDEFYDRCDADMVFVCIATPRSEKDGSIFLDYMIDGLQTLGPWVQKRVHEGHYPHIVMRSTMLPKLSEREILPRLEEYSGCSVKDDFGYAHLPEILRETDAVEDSNNIWQVVIGKVDDPTAEKLYEMFARELRQSVNGDHEKMISVVPVDVAEASKVLVNTFNATVISYYNMMDEFLDELDIDAQEAIDLAVRMGEGKLNRWYGTVAGFPYGGKCLPKDTAAMLAMADDENLPLVQLHATRQVNHHMKDRAENGEVPDAVKDGFRRAPAEMLQESTIEAYCRYHRLTG
jgi:GDP-mannose 6-dehydrogenase